MKSNLPFNVTDTVARAVAFVARHASVPIHVSCIRRLNPDRLSLNESRICLIRAAQLLERQRRAESSLVSRSPSASPSKLKSSAMAATSSSHQHLAILGFFQVAETETIKGNSSTRLSVKISEVPFSKLAEQLVGTPLEPDDISLFSSESTSCHVSQQQLQQDDNNNGCSLNNLVGIWFTDRSVATLNDEVGSSLSTSSSSSASSSQQRLADILAMCAWRIDLEAMFDRFGFDLGDDILATDEQLQHTKMKMEQNGDEDQQPVVLMKQRQKSSMNFLGALPQHATSFTPAIQSESGSGVVQQKAVAKRNIFECNGSTEYPECFLMSEKFVLPRNGGDKTVRRQREP